MTELLGFKYVHFQVLPKNFVHVKISSKLAGIKEPRNFGQSLFQKKKLQTYMLLILFMKADWQV
jgi:hypothetical protein